MSCNILEQPKTFYHYRNFNNFTIDSLCSDSFYFSNPHDFNDPFDCNPKIQCDSNIHELKELLSKMIKTRVAKEVKNSLEKNRLDRLTLSDLPSKQSINAATERIGYIEYMATDPEYDADIIYAEYSLLTSAIEDEFRSHYERGIFCFSTKYSNPLLWSHYADKHQGICIGYTTNRTPKPLPRKIVYGGSRVIKTSMLHQAIVKNDAQASEDLDRDFLLRKSADWCYEDEWRLIGRQGVQASPMLLTEVTFGLRCPPSVIHMVTSALVGRKSPVKFYVMHMGSNEYSLERVEFDGSHDFAECYPITANSPEEDFGIQIEAE